MSFQYPKRPAFFAHRFCRLMGKVCLGGEIGPEACWLLAYLAHTEDAAGYRRPVIFFNEDLATRTGLSVSAMRRARDRCVKAGWLAHKEGAKRRPATYYVTVPAWAQGRDDAAGDEEPRVDGEPDGQDIPRHFDAETDGEAAGKRPGSGREAAGKRPGSEHPSSHSHSHSHSQDPPPPRGGGEGVAVGFTAKLADGTEDDPGSGMPDGRCRPRDRGLPSAEDRALADKVATATGGVESVPAFGEFLGAWNSSRLPGAGKVGRLSERVAAWQQMLRDVPDFRDGWRSAIADLSRSAKARGEEKGFSGVRVEYFLSAKGWQHYREGYFPPDGSEPSARARDPAKSKGDVVFERAKREAEERKRQREAQG